MALSTRRIAALSLLALLSLIASETHGGEPFVVRDINPEPGPPLSSDPQLTQVVGDGRLFFFARDPVHGTEPWITDGTERGTRLLRDVCPGPCWSDPDWQWSLGGQLLFTVSEDLGEKRLWVSDGTWGGTRPLGSGIVRTFPLVGGLEDRGRYFFSAFDGPVEGQATGLWVTDGTPAGTRRLGAEGPDGWPLIPRGNSFRTDGTLLFSAFRPETGNELWASDGSEAGTRLVADLRPGPEFSSPGAFRQLPAGTVFFADEVANLCATSLWVSDGTAPGTRHLVEFSDTECRRTLASPILRAGGAVYFVAKTGAAPRQLWRSDGTPAGIRALTGFDSEAFADRSSFVNTTAVSDAGLLFVADDGAHGTEPWFADAAGARMVADLCPGICSSQLQFPAWHDGAFYFQADDGSHGLELWRSDGTAAGTRLIHDACPGSCDSFAVAVGSAGGRVFFFTDFPEQTGEDRALWATEGGEETVRLTDLAPPLFNSTIGFSTFFATLGDLLLFANVDAEHGRELWRSDGTPEGTRIVADGAVGREVGAGSTPILLRRRGNEVLFFAYEPGFGYQPWASDGSAGGTRRLGVIVEQGPTPTFPLPYAEPLILGTDAFFLAEQPSGRLELWRAPAVGAPVRLLDLPGESADFDVARLVRLGNSVVLLASGPVGELGGVWISDGTAAGSRLVREMAVFDRHQRLERAAGVELNSEVFLAGAADLFFDVELWKTDGTAAGTVLVKDIATGDRSSSPAEFVRLGGRLLFTATTEEEGRELWTTDGTAAGTRLVADLEPGFVGSDPHALTVVGDRVFFFASDFFGVERLWTTDGTAAGTIQVAEVPQRPFSFPESPTEAAGGGRLFFLVQGPDFRNELWVSDGTAAGTTSIQRVLGEHVTPIGLWSAGDRMRVSTQALGSAYGLWETDGTFAGTRQVVSLPYSGFDVPITEPTEAGPLLFFAGAHPEAGAELMALRTGPPEPCAADAETLCLGGGRFAVRVHWRDPRSGDEGTGGALPFPGSDRTGMFWFFQQDNVELVLKVLDGGPINGYFWNFYGALSDVEYWIEVEDTLTGRRAEYHNPAGTICGRGDTRALPSRSVVMPAPAQAAPAPTVAAAPAPGSGTACGGGPGALCLLDGRFRVEVEWTDQRSGDSGIGTAVPGTDRSGFFWFFNQTNIELVVKMLDGRQVNGRFWVFYGALSDVEYTITVTDTEAGDHAEYRNPPGEICGRGDTAAF
jgi:ELWxxDGT repeat protein